MAAGQRQALTAVFGVVHARLLVLPVGQGVTDDAARRRVPVGGGGQTQFRLASGQLDDDLRDLAALAPGDPAAVDRHEAERLEVLFEEAPVPVQSVGDEAFASSLEQSQTPRPRHQQAAELARVAERGHHLALPHFGTQRQGGTSASVLAASSRLETHHFPSPFMVATTAMTEPLARAIQTARRQKKVPRL